MQRVFLAVGVFVVVCACGAWSQEGPRTAQRKATAAEAAEKPSGRLPNNYGKLGLTDAQKEKIYSIQAGYADRIEELMQQIEELRTKRDGEIAAVLTAEQRDRLSALKEEAARKAASRKEEAAKAKTESAAETKPEGK